MGQGSDPRGQKELVNHKRELFIIVLRTVYLKTKFDDVQRL